MYRTREHYSLVWYILTCVRIYQTSENPFSIALIGYTSSQYPLDIYWFEKQMYMRASNYFVVVVVAASLLVWCVQKQAR